MEKRSLRAFDHYKDADQRFEYFITGVVGALIAFIVQEITKDQNIILNLFKIMSVILLLISFYYSIKRMELVVRSSQLNFRLLDNYEQKGQLSLNVSNEKILNKESGDILTNEQIHQEINKINKLIPELQKELERLKLLGGKYYKYRNNMFYISLVMYLIVKTVLIFM